MSKKQIKIMKSIIAIITAISINACCVMQAYALPEPSPDWWQAATVIVGGAAAKGTAVVSAPVVIGSVIVALGVCAGAWAVTHPEEFSEVVNGVKSRISSLLVGKDGSGMLVKMDEGVPYLDEESLDQIAQALHDGGYLSSQGWDPSGDTTTGLTYTIQSLASVEEVFNFLREYYASQYGIALWYDNASLSHLYSYYPYLQNGNYFMAISMTGSYIFIRAFEKQVGDTISFPFRRTGNVEFFISSKNGVSDYMLPYGENTFYITWQCLGLRDGNVTNANGTATDDFGTTENVVQVDGDTVTMPEWIGDVKESIDDLGNTIKNYPIALPSGTAIPYIFPDTTPETDIKTMVQDVPIPEDKPIPDIAEEGRTQEEVQNPDSDEPIETLPDEPLTESTLPSLKLPAALAQRFPFSLVSDINVLISKLSGTGEAPHFSIPVKIDLANIDTSIDVDLSIFNGAVSVIRPVILACAVFGIIRLTFKVINV